MPPPLMYLADYREAEPNWLNDEILDDESLDVKSLLEKFFQARTSFYPGSGTDLQLLEIFGKANSVHCHVHADFQISAGQALSALEGFDGYQVFGYKHFSPDELGPFEAPFPVDLVNQNEPPVPPINPGEAPQDVDQYWESSLDTSLIAVFRRLDDFDESHGPKFQCFLHIHADAYWTYWNLWAKLRKAPYAMILQDHGNNANHEGHKFGGEDSFILSLAQRGKCMPKFLLVGENTESWPGYQNVTGWAPQAGQNNMERSLYQIEPA